MRTDSEWPVILVHDACSNNYVNTLRASNNGQGPLENCLSRASLIEDLQDEQS